MNKETVDFVPNYDGKEREPTVLPTRRRTAGERLRRHRRRHGDNIPPHN